MSFPKASIKRFNETTGCAPAPGTYDPKSGDKAAGGVVDKSERFKASKDAGSASSSTSTTPVKQLFAAPQNIKRPPKSATSSADANKVKELEREIKRLLKERTDQDKLLSNKDEEIKKLEGRLLNAKSDKSSLQTKLAAAEKELLSVKKSNELLKNKVTLAENKKQEQLQAEVTSLKHQLQQKDQEIAQLRQDLHLAIGALVSEMQMFESTTLVLEKQAESYSNFMALVLGDTSEKDAERKKDKKENKKKEDIEVKLRNEKLTIEEKVGIVQKHTQVLSDRFTKALKDLEVSMKTVESTYRANMNKQTELQETLAKVEKELKEALDMKKTLEEQKADLLDSNGNLNDKMKELLLETQQKDDSYRVLQQNLEDLKESNESLHFKLEEVEKVHQQSLKQDADRIISLEERELVIQVVTKGLNERIIELQAQNEDLLAALGENEKVLNLTKEENQNLVDIISELKENFEQERSVFINQFEELEKEKSKVDNNLVLSEQKITELKDNLEKQKSDAENSVKELQEKLKSNEAELEQLQDKLGDFVYEKSQLHMEIGHLEAKLKLLNCESEKAREEKDNAFQVIPKLKEEVNTLLIEKKNAEEQIGQLIAQNSALQGTLEVFQSDFDVYVENAEKDKGDLHHKIAELTQEADGLREQRDHMSKELDDWLTEKSELEIEIAKLQCRIKVLEMENEQAGIETEKQTRCQKEEIDRLKMDKKKLEQDLVNETAKIKSLQTELQCQSEDHTILEEKFQQLELCFDEQNEHLTSVEEKYSKLEITLEKQNEEIFVAEAKNSELECKIEELNEEMEQYAEKNKELEIVVEKRCKEMIETEEKYGELWAKIQEQEERVCQLREENEHLETNLENQNKELAAACEKNAQLIETLEKVKRHVSEMEGKTKELELHIHKQEEEVDDKNNRIKEKDDKIRKLEQLYESKCEECESLTETCERLQGDMSILSKTMTVIETKLEHVEKDLAKKCEECSDLTKKNDELDTELTLSVRENVDLGERVDSLLRENERIEVYEAEIEDLKQQLEFVTRQEQQGLKEEAQKYKNLYEELLARIEPFMEQLDSFELEKQFLLGRSQATEEEMEKLKKNYCDLLGHQNKKQKIKHIVKLKDENSALRKEVAILREQTVRQQRQIEKSSLSNKGKENAPLEKSTVSSRGKANPVRSTTPLKSRQLSQTENANK